MAVQKGFHSNEDYVDFINYAFGMNGASSSFYLLLPKLFKKGRSPADDTYFELDGEKILGTVGSFPLEFSFLGEKLSVRGIGNVATHPSARGKGFMKLLMKAAIDDMIKDKVALSVLGGRRHRYAHFGFEKCDGMTYFNITPKTVSYVMDIPDDIEMKRLSPDDTETLDILLDKMNSRPFCAVRKRDDLYDILVSWSSVPYAFFKDNRLVGWAVHYVGKGQLSEFYSLDKALTQKLVAKAVSALGSLSVAIHPAERSLAAEVSVLAENVNIISNECFLVLDWFSVLSLTAKLKASSVKLADGVLTVLIKGVRCNERLKITVENGQPRVEKTDASPDITLSQNEASRLFFGNFSEKKDALSPIPASWLPLPLCIYEPDNV